MKKTKTFKRLVKLGGGIILALALVFTSKVAYAPINSNDHANMISRIESNDYRGFTILKFEDDNSKLHVSSVTIRDPYIIEDIPDKPEQPGSPTSPEENIPEEENLEEENIPEESKELVEKKTASSILGVISLVATVGIAGLLVFALFKRKKVVKK